MKVHILGINYYPELIGISVYSTDLCTYLYKKGYDVEVFTAFPYYPHWKKNAKDRFRLFKKEKVNGVSVRRSYVFVPEKVHTFTRILHELSFMISSFFNILFASKPDLLITVSPPLGLGMVSIIISKLKNIPFIFHVQDLQPDAAAELSMLKPGIVLRVLYAMERKIYKHASKISVISEKMAEKIKSKIFDSKKVILFSNWVDCTSLQPQPKYNGFRSKYLLDRKFVVLYSGNIGFKQGLNAILDTAKKTDKNDGIFFLIAGDGAYKTKLIDDFKRSKLKKVQFLPVQSATVYPHLLSACDICLIPQKKSEIDFALPSKLLAIMAVGKPVIVQARKDSELCKIVSEAHCGFVIGPENVNDIADTLLYAYEHQHELETLGRNGRKYVQENFERGQILNDFEEKILLIH